jgi:DNA-binding CsgD family transcriptional regulator
MKLPNDLNMLIESANKSGAAVMVLDTENHISFVNDRLKDIYRVVDFKRPQTYESFFLSVLENNLHDDPTAYSNPSDWLGRALYFKRTVPFAQYTIKLNSGQIYITRHQIFPDLGSISIRLEIPTRDLFFSSGRISGCTYPRSLGNGLFSFSNPYEEDVSKALVSRVGIIVDADHSFIELTNLMDGVSIKNGKIVLSDKLENRKLHNVISDIASGADKNDTASLKITRKDYGKFYICNVSVPSPISWTGHSKVQDLVVVSIIDPFRALSIQPLQLEQIFNLTPSEARVAIAIAMGKELSEIAINHNIAVGTVRNQLKSVFQKMGVSRQSDLVRVVLRIARIISNSNF